MVSAQLNQLMSKAPELPSAQAAATAAQVAANEADAILDSLNVPHIGASSVPANVSMVPPPSSSGSSSGPGPASITDVEKEDSSDESNGDLDEAGKGMTTRRVLRRKE